MHAVAPPAAGRPPAVDADRERPGRPASHLETVVRCRLPVDLDLTLRVLRHGRGDPTVARTPGGAWWRATRTPLGPATVRYAREPSEPGGVAVAAWGPGAEWALEAAPDLLGARDSLEGFDPPRGGIVREVHRRLPGLRVGRSNAVFEAAVPTILAQKVTSTEATRSHRDLAIALGDPAPAAPGAAPALILPPSPSRIASTPYFAMHPYGIERRRAETLRTVAVHAARLEEALRLPPRAAERRLRLLRGIGPWTAGTVIAVALGDPDAVPEGDFHHPHTIAWALAGEPRGDDARMLELLAPYAGHRGRVLRLLTLAGPRAPAFGHRKPLRSFRRC